MRKLLLLAFTFLFTLSSQAQLAPVDEILEGDITTNITLTSDKKYLLRGFVQVREGATITIQPGTVIYGEKSSKGTLIINRGARIVADGTAQRPIVFTSQQPRGQRGGGDWGGLIIAGRAAINTATGEALLEGGTNTTYGGGSNPNDDDSSGILRYVRVEFPGIEFTPDNEINGITMGGVGRGTIMENIQVSFSGDDAYEWFGGTVNGRNFVSIGALDDSFDADTGWRGNVQFGLIVRDPDLADISTSNGFELDNSASEPAGGQAAQPTPRQAGTFSNITVIGPLGGGVVAGQINNNYGRAVHARRAPRTAIYNSIFMGFPGAVRLDGPNLREDAESGNFQIRNSIFTGTFQTNQTGFDVAAWFNTSAHNNRTAATAEDVGLANPFLFGNVGVNATNFDPRPATGSLAATHSASFDFPRLPSSFFTPTTFVGAFAAGGERWDLPWANYDPQNTDYTVTSNEAVEIPGVLSLTGIYPNPFSERTAIEFALERPQPVRLAIYDAMGREVALLHNGIHAAGNGFFHFDGRSLPGGTYFVRFEAEQGTATRAITLVK